MDVVNLEGFTVRLQLRGSPDAAALIDCTTTAFHIGIF